MHRYNFIEAPIVSLHKTAVSILPGIEKVVTVFYDDVSKSLKGNISEKQNGGYSSKDLEVASVSAELLPFRRDKTPFTWFNKDSIPFEVKNNTGSPVIDIFTELKNVVLLLRLPGAEKGLSDLAFLYFNENPGNFGVSNSDSPLSTESKSVIAFLLYNTLKYDIETKRRNKKVLIFNNERTQKIIAQTEKLSEELQRTHDNYGLSLVKLCRQYLKEHGRKNNRSYVFSRNALEKISNYKGDLKNLERIIEETVDYVNSLYPDVSGEIKITEWHLDFDTEHSFPDDYSEEPRTTDKYSKTISLLNRLEQAALIVRKQKLKLTGTNVGRSCEVPISAPAISDALYNHKSRITVLLEKYPDKWETIRAEFRPLKNILEKNRK